MGQYLLQETVGGEATGGSNRSFLQETQLDSLLLSVTLFSKMIHVLTFALDCFSCNFTLFFNTCNFYIAFIVSEANVTLIRYISMKKKENKMFHNNGVGEGASMLKRQKKKQAVCYRYL